MRWHPTLPPPTGGAGGGSGTDAAGDVAASDGPAVDASADSGALTYVTFSLQGVVVLGFLPL